MLHQTIRKVTSDIENLKFNTAISALMVFNNYVMKKGKIAGSTADTFAKLLSPFAPHLGEELWEITGKRESLAYEKWPEADDSLLVEENFEYPVSFNGKMRFKMELPVSITEEEAEKTLLAHEKTSRYLEGKNIMKIILVRNKIINIVIR